MKESPHIKFELNQALDKEILLDFISEGEPKAGLSFIDEIISVHPKAKALLALTGEQLKTASDDFVEDFYLKNNEILINSANTFQKNWNTAEDAFFNQAKNIFSSPWPTGKYISYVSILPIGPRFLDDSTFQTCWLWEKSLIGQVVHELLHFQFFNLASLTGFDKLVDEDTLWEISEIFNDIVQCLPEFVAIQGYAPKPGYPGHIEKIAGYKKIWQENPTAEGFLRNISEGSSNVIGDGIYSPTK